MKRRLRTFSLGLSRELWLLQLGGVVNALGTGLVFPFVALYLHAVRGFSLPVAGLVVASLAAAGIPAALAAGRLVDRHGSRPILGAALALSALGYGALPFVRTPIEAAAAMVVAGVGTGAFWPAQSAVLVALASREQRPLAFSVQRALLNFGIGAGAAGGGLVARVDRPSTYTWLFLLDALSFVVYALVLLRVRPPSVEPAAAPSGQRGYGALLRDRVALAVIGMNVLYVVGGYCLLEVALPIFAHDFPGVHERGIGIVFLVNTVAVVVLQLPVARLLEGRSRMRALAAMSFLWAAIWIAVLLGGTLLDGTAALGVFVCAVALFALGECVLAPAQSALVAELAPESLRGRYLAALTTSHAVGFAIGPALVGALLDLSEPLAWACGAGLLLGAGACALALDGRVPTEVRSAPARPRAARRRVRTAFATERGVSA